MLQANKNEFLCDQTHVNYSQNYVCGTSLDRYKTFPLTKTVKQTGHLLRNPPVKLLFYNLLSRCSAKNPEGMQTLILFCYVSVSGWCDPGCRHPTSTRCCGTSSMQQILSSSLPLPPFLHPKSWKGAPSWYYCCFAMKLKQSLTWWSVQWCSEWRIFLALKKEKGRGVCA